MRRQRLGSHFLERASERKQNRRKPTRARRRGKPAFVLDRRTSKSSESSDRTRPRCGDAGGRGAEFRLGPPPPRARALVSRKGTTGRARAVRGPNEHRASAAAVLARASTTRSSPPSSRHRRDALRSARARDHAARFRANTRRGSMPTSRMRRSLSPNRAFRPGPRRRGPSAARPRAGIAFGGWSRMLNLDTATAERAPRPTRRPKNLSRALAGCRRTSR